MEYCTVRDTIELLHIDERFITKMEREEIISVRYDEKKEEKLLSESDVERLRIAKILMEDMGINLHGVEVILRMRENMFQMRRQFDEILKDLSEEIRRVMKYQNK
ncbi:MAG TPA: chaperone modulator CbpM [Deltaproteobacteria bacterium]|jgi:MerR family transcriptional regulator/heat shock protein HspR|nr:chaperone modulator CbpM [Deltaproteobacteria bacterium]HQJ08654.1 chaperone modulator CbpM [Deltaproteobacteria bacterium]